MSAESRKDPHPSLLLVSQCLKNLQRHIPKWLHSANVHLQAHQIRVFTINDCNGWAELHYL